MTQYTRTYTDDMNEAYAKAAVSTSIVTALTGEVPFYRNRVSQRLKIHHTGWKGRISRHDWNGNLYFENTTQFDANASLESLE